MRIHMEFDGMTDLISSVATISYYLDRLGCYGGDDGCDIEPPAEDGAAAPTGYFYQAKRDHLYQSRPGCTYQPRDEAPAQAASEPTPAADAGPRPYQASYDTGASRPAEGIVVQPPAAPTASTIDMGAAMDFGAPPPVDEDYRRSVRAKLAELNKRAGVNLAKELIPQIAGVARLTEVPLDKLEALMAAAKAKEAELSGSAAK